MMLLAIETATSRLSVALIKGSDVLARADQEAAGKHAKLLIPTIDQLLKASGLTLAELGGLAVSIGPGSFTGLRVGLATVMGFRMVTGLPLAAVPTLEGMAWNFTPTRPKRAKTRSFPVDAPLSENGVLCPILKSRTGEVYWACYQWLADGTLKRIGDERVGSLAQMTQEVCGPIIVFGEGWRANREELMRLFRKRRLRAQEAPPDGMNASAVSIALAGQAMLARGEIAGHSLSPRYVQRAEAELVMERRAVGVGAR